MNLINNFFSFLGGGEIGERTRVLKNSRDYDRHAFRSWNLASRITTSLSAPSCLCGHGSSRNKRVNRKCPCTYHCPDKVWKRPAVQGFIRPRWLQRDERAYRMGINPTVINREIDDPTISSHASFYSRKGINRHALKVKERWIRVFGLP